MNRYGYALIAAAVIAALPFVPVTAQPAKPVRAAIAQFRELHWIAGSWRGSGGAYPAQPGSGHTVGRDGIDRDERAVRERGLACGGFTFKRQSADVWTATLHPARAGGAETVYTMRRVRR